MHLALTLMVRDEADIIAPMIQHHLNQGVDTILVTDNGSTDGTREILEGFAAEGKIQLAHDPEHRKQQARVVTAMARRAYTEFGADWVINADADEFWVTADPTLTLKDAFSRIPASTVTFIAPVFDMIGEPAEDGSGINRLTYRDLRTPEQLREIGLIAHATPDSPHIGSAEVEVVQGNHSVNLPAGDPLDPALAIEVLHLPWRSWAQYRRKVENAGRAYELSGLTPSPNHHGMRDYRRLKEGTLRALYVARHPLPELIPGHVERGELVPDTRLVDVFPDARADIAFEARERDLLHPLGAAIGRTEESLRLAEHELRVALAERNAARSESEHDRAESLQLRDSLASVLAQRDSRASIITDLQQRLAAVENRRVVKLVDRAAATLRGIRHPSDPK
ncbi:glycosyltransferase family 2 protein [Mycetocola sp. JXN-3]|uniref:glycosyltransferase family 2 protein n=1 Tax=Mycetocola sp. JXN-3 TaxID=2116510 RepID=UPI002106DF21|nr:glycosyltransferase family 2 protein [Mycetocola sp. JXN-3]